MMSLNVETLKRATGPLFFYSLSLGQFASLKAILPGTSCSHNLRARREKFRYSRSTLHSQCCFRYACLGRHLPHWYMHYSLVPSKKPQVRPSTISILKPTSRVIRSVNRDPTGVGSRFNLSAQFVVKNDWTRG